MKRFLIAAALLLAAAFAHAQQLPPGKWWQRPEVIEQLGLTTEQQDRLDEIFRAAANGLIDAKGDVEKVQIALRAELDRPQMRRPEVLRLVSQLNDARGRLFEREVTMLVDMRAVLTEQQWRRMRDQLDRMRARQQRQPNRGGARPRR
ncbi:MAG TPA: periplasmic heavy metal sensor [Vicinamibacterales bacterium]|nr:periplasmic heavy metal sensor [Vicinamibacterales bacterium]